MRCVIDKTIRYFADNLRFRKLKRIEFCNLQDSVLFICDPENGTVLYAYIIENIIMASLGQFAYI